MNKKRAVVFDFDGTLSNSFPLVIGKITEAIAMFRDEELTEEENNSIYGPTEEGIILKLIKDRGEAKECFLRYLDLYNQYHDELLPDFIPGIRELLEELNKRNIPVFLLTGRSKESTMITLTKFNAFKYFKAIYTGGLYGEVKEELLNELALVHHYDKEDLVYIGDSLHDVPQCRRANVDIISVSYANTDGYEKLEEINKGNVAKTVEELKAKLFEIL